MHERAKKNKGTLTSNGVTAFLVTLSNPLIIFLFIGLFARFSFVEPGELVSETLTGYLSIVAGALLWWFGITWFVDKVRNRFNLHGILYLNRAIGGIVMAVSVIGFILLNNYVKPTLPSTSSTCGKWKI